MDFFHVYWQPPRTPSTPRKRRLPSSPPPQRHNQRDHQQQRQPHDTALRPRRPSAPQRAAHGMFPKQMPLRQHPAVRSAVEIRLPPVPRRVKAHRPPQRPRVPKTQAKNRTRAHYRRQSHRRLTGISPVQEPEKQRKQDQPPPEAEPARD